MKNIKLTFVALLLGSTAIASAHNLWMLGENKTIFEADLLYGLKFPESEKIAPERLVLFEAPVVTDEAKITL